MLNEILGYMIAPDGAFISFGEWTPTVTFDSSYENFHQYSAINSINQNKWNLKYPELGLDEVLNPITFQEDIYVLFEEWSKLGFSFIINDNSIDTFRILGYFPKTSSFFQKITFLHLRNNILYRENIESTILQDGEYHEELNIYSIYGYLLQELFIEDSSRKKEMKNQFD